MTTEELIMSFEAENKRLEARLQAAEETIDEKRAQYVKSLDELHDRAETAEWYVAEVTELCDEIDRGEHAIKGTGSIDFGRGMAHASKQFRAALAGGTSPEPTEPACTDGLACMITSHIDCRWPVDVASEPPNPPDEEPVSLTLTLTATDLAVAYLADELDEHSPDPLPVGEPLKPTEQEQQ